MLDITKVMVDYDNRAPQGWHARNIVRSGIRHSPLLCSETHGRELGTAFVAFPVCQPCTLRIIKSYAARASHATS